MRWRALLGAAGFSRGVSNDMASARIRAKRRSRLFDVTSTTWLPLDINDDFPDDQLSCAQSCRNDDRRTRTSGRFLPFSAGPGTRISLPPVFSLPAPPLSCGEDAPPRPSRFTAPCLTVEARRRVGAAAGVCRPSLVSLIGLCYGNKMPALPIVRKRMASTCVDFDRPSGKRKILSLKFIPCAFS